MPLSNLQTIGKHGVLTLYGFGIKVRVDRGHLFAEWGIGTDRDSVCLPRVNHGLRRLVMIGNDGFITLEALRWLADQDAAFVMLDKRGKVIVVCGPCAPSDSKLRRAQALAPSNGTALRISKELISQKLTGQATLVSDMLYDSASAGTIVRFRAELPSAESIEVTRFIEARAAKAYWQAWSDVQVQWPRKDEKLVPERFKRFGSRISPLTHSPRQATNAPNAILNFLYAILESESRLAATAMGLDPGIGFLHADAPNRDSLACDIMEVVRPRVDAFVLDWLQTEPLRKLDFREERNGNCRLVSALAIRLCETAETWRKFVAPVVEYVAQELWASIRSSVSRLTRQPIATRLTQRHKREVKGSDVPLVKAPKPDSVCCGCGKIVRRGRHYCRRCTVTLTNENFNLGRKEGNRPEHLAKRASTMRAHREQIAAWKPSGSDISRDIYMTQIQPALARISKTRIASALGVSQPYSSDIRAGKKVPHPRFFQILSNLAKRSA